MMRITTIVEKLDKKDNEPSKEINKIVKIDALL